MKELKSSASRDYQNYAAMVIRDAAAYETLSDEQLDAVLDELFFSEEARAAQEARHDPFLIALLDIAWAEGDQGLAGTMLSATNSYRLLDEIIKRLALDPDPRWRESIKRSQARTSASSDPSVSAWTPFYDVVLEALDRCGYPNIEPDAVTTAPD